MTSLRDPRVDAYVAKAAPFAQPILRQVREVVHRACPEVTETIKWGMPHFVHHDETLCGMAAFKAHASFWFWHDGMKELVRPLAKTGDGMGQFGRITQLSDLPGERKLQSLVRAAMRLIDAGVPARVTTRKPAKAVRVPADLAAALRSNAKAAQTYRELSPSHRREYVEWITEAKRSETRTRRLETTITWLAQGKSRNWKYEKC